MCFAGAGYLNLFLPAPTQNFQDLEKSACGRDPKADEARGGPKKLSMDISALCLLQDPKRLIYGGVESIIDPLLHREQNGIRRGNSTKKQAILLTKNIEDFLSICPSDSGL